MKIQQKIPFKRHNWSSKYVVVSPCKEQITKKATAKPSSELQSLSLDLLLMAGRALTAQNSTDKPTNKGAGEEKQNLLVPQVPLRKRRLLNPMLPLNSPPKLLEKSLSTLHVLDLTLSTIQDDAKDMNWRKVCKPLPPQPRLPKVPAGHAYSERIP